MRFLDILERALLFTIRVVMSVFFKDFFRLELKSSKNFLLVNAYISPPSLDRFRVFC